MGEMCKPGAGVLHSQISYSGNVGILGMWVFMGIQDSLALIKV
jgi:hypothetical protein